MGYVCVADSKSTCMRLTYKCSLWLVPSPVGSTQSTLRCADFTPDRKATNNFQRLLSVANTKIDLQQIRGQFLIYYWRNRALSTGSVR